MNCLINLESIRSLFSRILKMGCFFRRYGVWKVEFAIKNYYGKF